MPHCHGMKRMHRYDKGTLEITERGDGFLRARVRIARDGVFPYLYPNGKIYREAKLADDITSEFTVNSAKGKPVTDNHPPVSDSKGLVTPQNASKYVKGSLGDSITVSREDGIVYLDGFETIYDQALIDKVERGEQVELSIGFDCDIDDTPGEYKGERYDSAQRNIEINHIAHVDRGRAGENCRAYLDGADDDTAVMTEHKDERSNTMPKPRTDEKGFFAYLRKYFTDEDDTTPPAGDKNAAPAKSAEGGEPADTDATEQLKAQIEALKIMLAEKTKELEELSKTAKAATAPETLDALIAARTKLVDAARAIIPDVKTDGMKDRDIKLAVISKALPFEASVKTDSCDNTVVDARFDAALAIEREKAAVRGDNSASESRLDEAAIDKKRMARLSMQNQ